MSLLELPVVALLCFAPLQQEEPPVPRPQEPSVPIETGHTRESVRLSTLFEGALMDAENGQDFRETEGYRRLLVMFAGTSWEELQAKATQDFDYARVMADPAAFRGEMYRTRRLIAGMKAERLAQPIGDQIDVYRAFVGEADGTEGMVVDFLELPQDKFELGRDVVDLETVFYRTVTYENQKGEMQTAPYFIARSLRRVDLETAKRKTVLDWFGWFMLIAIGAFVLVRVVFSRTSKRARTMSARESEKLSRSIWERAHGGREKPDDPFRPS